MGASLPGHAGVEGNELADRATKEGSLHSQSETNIDMESAMRQVRHFT